MTLQPRALSLEKRLLIVAPIFNEEENVNGFVETVLRATSLIGLDGVELLVVNDGSTDSSGLRIGKLVEKYAGRVSSFSHPVNMGYGSAIRSGARIAEERGFPWALFIDSDLTNPPSDIPKFLDALGPEIAMVKASRYLTGSSDRQVKAKRRALSRIARSLTHLLTRWPVTDPTNGFRCVNLSVYNSINFKSADFSLIMEEVYEISRKGLQIREVPSILGTRSKQGRPTSFRYTPLQLWRYFRWPLKYAIRRAALQQRVYQRRAFND